MTTSASAQDWFVYGRFLDDAGFSPRFAYACILKSEDLLRSLSNPAIPDAMIAAQKQIEKRLGAEAASIRRDPEPSLQEALALRH